MQSCRAVKAAACVAPRVAVVSERLASLQIYIYIDKKLSGESRSGQGLKKRPVPLHSCRHERTAPHLQRFGCSTSWGPLGVPARQSSLAGLLLLPGLPPEGRPGEPDWLDEASLTSAIAEADPAGAARPGGLGRQRAASKRRWARERLSALGRDSLLAV